jgi:hypothetical protein
VADVRRLLLVHDILDCQLVDRHETKVGRVDALVLEVIAGQPPRVKSILVGGAVRHERIGRWAMWLGCVLRRIARSDTHGVSEIPFAAVRRLGSVIAVVVDQETLDSECVERWLRDNVVGRVPGGMGERE